jgi:hypothetical protein
MTRPESTQAMLKPTNERAYDEGNAPGRAGRHRREGRVGRLPNIDQPPSAMKPGKRGNALDAVGGPGRNLAALLYGKVLFSAPPVADITPDPVACVHAAGNDDPFLVDDRDDAARGQSLHSKRLLETFEPGSRCQDGNESTGAILERARDADDPASALISTPHVTDRELPAGQDLREERAVCGIDVSRSRCPDIGSIEGKYADMGDVVGQLAPDLPEQRVIRRDVARIYRRAPRSARPEGSRDCRCGRRPGRQERELR